MKLREELIEALGLPPDTTREQLVSVAKDHCERSRRVHSLLERWHGRPDYAYPVGHFDDALQSFEHQARLRQMESAPTRVEYSCSFCEHQLRDALGVPDDTPWHACLQLVARHKTQCLLAKDRARKLVTDLFYGENE